MANEYRLSALTGDAATGSNGTDTDTGGGTSLVTVSPAVPENADKL